MRPVSSVKTRNGCPSRDARSTIIIPSFWKLVAMAKELGKVAVAQARICEAEATSSFAYSPNLYLDYGV
jgi:hypothetical protein